MKPTAPGGNRPLDKLTRAASAIYSLEAARRMRGLIALVRPQIAHAHNIYHHLSPSVLVELHRQHIPVVLTLHDLKLVCPAYKMHTQGAICEGCRGGALRNVVQNRCIKNSTAMSALVWLESTVHKALDLYMRNVTRFVVPSRFFLDKFAEWGVDTSRFAHIPNSIDVDALESTDEPGDAFVYLGRLVPEKGVATLVKAAAKARVRLRIIGTGPEEAALRQLAEELGGDVEFTGYLSGCGAARGHLLGARGGHPLGMVRECPVERDGGERAGATHHRRGHRRHPRIDPARGNWIHIQERRCGLAGRGLAACSGFQARPAAHGRGGPGLDARRVQSRRHIGIECLHFMRKLA